jgi:hypothetical protein
MPRVTAADARDPFAGAAQGAVLLDGCDEVVTARRRETAVPAHDWPEQHLIAADSEDQDRFED